MSLNLNNLRPAYGAKKKKKRVGRGDSSGHGTYSTRGAKGQRARSGGKGGLKLKGLKGNILSIPKLGGFRSLRPKLEIVNLQDLEKNFENDDIITAGKLAAKGLIKGTSIGVKILGQGELTKKLIVKTNKISASAKEAVEKAGGKIILLLPYKKELKEEKK
ncbi:MAG: 50S ribosomal protein L15 [Patescibacteria group bacterium]